MTAAKLLDVLTVAGCHPALDGHDVTFDRPPPPDLDRYLDVLFTGVRALLMGKRWCGIDCETGHFLGRRGALNPAATLPRNVGLLIVEAAGEQWDRLSLTATDELPDCFDPEL